MADYLTLRDGDAVIYRPTVHYAYHPCDAAVMSVHELAGRGWQQQSEQRLMMEEIASGIDELGVLLMGHKKGAFWYGSQLTIEEARKLAPHNSATSLQVAAGVLGGMVCATRAADGGHRRGRRARLPARARGGQALSRPCRRRLQRLDARCRTGRYCFPKTLMLPIPGSSRTSWSADQPNLTRATASR